MRKQVSEHQLKVRRELARQLKGFKEYFAQPVSKKMLYLEELSMYHFHKYALRNTYSLNEYQFQQWVKTDEAFRDAVVSIRQQFIDSCEYMMLARAGYYNEEIQKRYKHVDNRAMAEFVKVARGYGFSRKYSGYGGASKAGATEAVPDGGKGEASPFSSPGGEGSVCSISETNPLP